MIADGRTDNPEAEVWVESRLRRRLVLAYSGFAKPSSVVYSRSETSPIASRRALFSRSELSSSIAACSAVARSSVKALKSVTSEIRTSVARRNSPDLQGFLPQPPAGQNVDAASRVFAVQTGPPGAHSPS